MDELKQRAVFIFDNCAFYFFERKGNFIMGLEMIQAGWLSIVPPLVAIILALITKEVFSSLFIGIFSGMLIYCSITGTSLIMAIQYVIDMMAYKLGDNAMMVIFLGLLGALVYVITKAGGSYAYGKWASTKLKNPISAKLATVVLGVLIFIDDYFNCLTVGTVMRPITDKFNISREKLAYIIDATAAPVCIIAPISSWAVAVSSELGGGLGAFMQTIPFNLYALLTISMIVFLCFKDFDFGPMKDAELVAQNNTAIVESEAEQGNAKGKVIDLVLPMLVLIFASILCMAAVGGFFKGVDFTTAIGENPTLGLALGAFIALAFAIVLYIPRKLMTFRQFMEGVSEGVKTMVGAIMILTLAWSLSGVCREMIGTGEFVSSMVASSSLSLSFLPMIVFLVAAFLSFSMGTAWGTFGILIPIVSMICAGDANHSILIVTLGATLAGSVYGDHCSPISDTTILSSAGAQCDHIKHVQTQIPYTTLVAAVCAVGYIIGGFTQNPWITLGCSEALLFIVLYVMKKRDNQKRSK